MTQSHKRFLAWACFVGVLILLFLFLGHQVRLLDTPEGYGYFDNPDAEWSRQGNGCS